MSYFRMPWYCHQPSYEQFSFSISKNFSMDALPGKRNFVLNRLFVTNFDDKTMWYELKEAFEQFGKVLYVKVRKDPRKPPYAFITFENPSSCMQARFFHDHIAAIFIHGLPLYINYASFAPKYEKKAEAEQSDSANYNLKAKDMRVNGNVINQVARDCISKSMAHPSGVTMTHPCSNHKCTQFPTPSFPSNGHFNFDNCSVMTPPCNPPPCFSPCTPCAPIPANRGSVSSTCSAGHTRESKFAADETHKLTPAADDSAPRCPPHETHKMTAGSSVAPPQPQRVRFQGACVGGNVEGGNVKPEK